MLKYSILFLMAFNTHQLFCRLIQHLILKRHSNILESNIIQASLKIVLLTTFVQETWNIATKMPASGGDQMNCQIAPAPQCAHEQEKSAYHYLLPAYKVDLFVRSDQVLLTFCLSLTVRRIIVPSLFLLGHFMVSLNASTLSWHLKDMVPSLFF